MPQVCSICRHPEREAIESALLRNTPVRQIAEQTQTSFSAIFRHKTHLSSQLVHAHRAQIVSEATSLLAKIEEVIADAKSITKTAEKKGDFHAALSGLRTITHALEVLGKVSGELQTPGAFHFHKHQSVHLHGTLPENEAAIEIELARKVAEITDNFSPEKIAELKQLAQAVDIENTA